MQATTKKRTRLFTGVVATVAALSLAAIGLAGCSSSTGSTTTSSDTAAAPAQETTHTLTLHRGYAAAHGDKCFTQVVVATAEDGTILGASIDDFQFMDATTAGITPVPNSDGAFAQGYASGKTLISKTINSAVYSQNMKAKAGATTDWVVSMQAIEKYAVGKKASELTNVSGPDAVSGATLEDTANYLAAVAKVAADNSVVSTGTYTGDGSDLVVKYSLAAAHGDKCFTSVVDVMQGDTIVATSVDDFQFMATTTAGLVPVPNSDGAFAQGYASGVALASKSVNHTSYSEAMKAKAGATTDWLTSMQAIEKYAAGKTASELTNVSGPDAVSGATLADTANYAKAIATTAQAK